MICASALEEIAVQEHELAPYPLFASLSKKEREIVGRYLDRIDVPAGRKLADEGSFAHEFFIIDDGEAAVTRGDDTLRTLGPGDFFGEIALLEADRRTASVTASTPMRLLVMHGRDFRSMVGESPEVAERVRAAIRERLAH
jgi:CRP/FNR family cyclic AMP-dependent transcriptional regulator